METAIETYLEEGIQNHTIRIVAKLKTLREDELTQFQTVTLCREIVSSSEVKEDLERQLSIARTALAQRDRGIA